MSDRGPFVFNLSLHAFILFSVLSMFFMLYVSKLEKDALQGELKSNIDQNLTQALQGNKSGFLFGNLPYPMLTRIYSKPDATALVHNQCLFQSLYMMMFVLALICVFVYL